MCILSCVVKFCENNIDVEVLPTIVKYITRSYCCIRVKYFARKLMSTDCNVLKLTRHSTLAAASNPAMFKSKKNEVIIQM